MPQVISDIDQIVLEAPSIIVRDGAGLQRALIDKSGKTAGAFAGPNAVARAHGLVAWTVDPALCATNLTQANTHLGSVYLEAGETITGIAVPVGTTATGCTFAAVGVYDAAGNLLAQSGDQHALFTNATTGWVSVPLTAPWTAPVSGIYYLASGFTASTTLPAVLNFAQNATCSVSYPATATPRGIHAQVPAGALPNPATAQGTFTNFPCLVAY